MSYDLPGLAYALDRIKRFWAPPVRFTPPPKDIRFLKDQELKVRDGTILRCNLFLPEGDGPWPAIVCAHPYGKDNLPIGKIPFTYRVMRQSAPFSVSQWTGWESPDPAYWAARGYALVNCDLRGFFRSEGEGDLFSDQEAEDYYDLVEWVAAQPWCTGKVATNGVSYLCISQWKLAALRPPHLHAMVAWEGFSDLYRDLVRPGGVREDGFTLVWSFAVSRQPRCRTRLREEQVKRDLRDEWYRSLTPDLPKIVTPALICGSFSDHNLHTRGSFRAFDRIASEQKWLYTHRGGKWAEYYSPEALKAQTEFLDHFLKDGPPPSLPRVRLEVRDTGDVVYDVRGETAWPLESTRWTKLFLQADQTLASAPGSGELTLGSRLSFVWSPDREVELAGPMKLRVELESTAPDVHLFAAVRKLRDGQEVTFEGSYGFNRGPVTIGMLRASHREPDEEQSKPWQPVHRHEQLQPLAPGQRVTLELQLLPSATVFFPGDTLRLDLQGTWFFLRNPILGAFPAGYQPSPPGRVTLHLGEAHLMVPVTREA